MSGQKQAITNFNDVLCGFRKWLIDEAGKTRDSANSYKSYLKKLCAAVNKATAPGWFESLLFDDKNGLSAEKLRQCSAFIEYNVRKCPKGSRVRKDWNNWRSAFHSFEDFLEDVNGEWNKWGVVHRDKSDRGRQKTRDAKTVCTTNNRGPVVGLEEYVRPEAVIRSLNHKELVGRFKNRLGTQRRCYPNIKFSIDEGKNCELLFPPGLIKKIFKGCQPNKNAWNKWLANGIEHIRILRSETGDFEWFSNVSRIAIYGNCRVSIILKDGTAFDMMTRTADGPVVKEHELERWKRNHDLKWADLTIDHVIPLENVLRAKVKQLEGLKKLSKKFSEFNEDGKLVGRDENSWCKELYESYQDELNNDEMRRLLATDLEIIDNCEVQKGDDVRRYGYELMDRSENSKKGKKGN